MTHATNSIPIRYVDAPRDASPWPRRESRAASLRLIIGTLAVIAAIAVAAFVARGILQPAPATGRVSNPVPGEFVEWRPSLVPARGEFRLGPGNEVPPGIQNPLVPDHGLSDPVEWRPSLVPVR